MYLLSSDAEDHPAPPPDGIKLASPQPGTCRAFEADSPVSGQLRRYGGRQKSIINDPGHPSMRAATSLQIFPGSFDNVLGTPGSSDGNGTVTEE
jgi:hypothetical protein